MAYSLIGTRSDLDNLLRSGDFTEAEKYLYKKRYVPAVRKGGDYGNLKIIYAQMRRHGHAGFSDPVRAENDEGV